MQGNTQPDDSRAELYARSLLPDGHMRQQADVIDRLEALSEEDVFDDVSVHVIGKQMPPTPAETRTDMGLFALNRVAVFKKWAKRNDCSLEPAFDVRTVDSAMTGERYRALVFPSQLLAEYSGSKLRCVTPHTKGSETVSVTDRIEMLERDEGTSFTSLERVGSVEPPTRPDAPVAELADEDTDQPLPK